jgi:outer membrane protein
MSSWMPILCVLTVLGSVDALAQAQSPPGGYAAGADTVRVDLPSVIQRALSVSPDILAQRAQTRFAKSRLDEALSSRILPEFSLTTAHAAAPGLRNPNGTPNNRLYLDPSVRNDYSKLSPFNRVDISMVQPLWTWGQLKGLTNAARAGQDYEDGQLATSREKVARRVAGLYYSVVLSEALDRLANEASKIISDAETEFEKLMDEGSLDVGEADLFQLRIVGFEIRGRKAEVREKARTARMALRRQLMLPDETVVMVKDRTLNPAYYELDSLDTYFRRGLQARPELSQLTAGVAALSSLVQVARSDYYPKVFWGVSAAYSGTSDRFRQRNPYVGDPFLTRSLETGLGIRMKLNFRQTRARVAQAQARVDGARQQESGARQLVLVEIENAYREVRFRREAVDAAEGALKESKDWLRFEQVNYDLDLGDTENLIKAVKANLELQAARHQAVFDLNMAYLDFFRAIGESEDLSAR